MIDLHTHTTYSDGTDTVKDLLRKANDVNLEIISITDHDDISSYKELENTNIDEYFNGKIIIGCEFTATFQDRLIEVLGYGFNYKIVDTYLSKFYTEDFNKKVRITLFNRLINKLKEHKLIYNEKRMLDRYCRSGFKEEYENGRVCFLVSFHFILQNNYKLRE